MRNFKKLFIVNTVVLTGLLLLLAAGPRLLQGESSGEGDNCFTIVVGKNATAKGGVLVAHNEDDGGKNFYVNVHKIPAKSCAPNDVTRLKHGTVIPRVKQNHGFLWLQIAGIDFGDTYINERGVTIVSNACPSREDQPQLENGGIGFMLRRLIAQRAATARGAVILAGKLIEAHGYYSSGRSYVLADANEAWVLQVIKGKHWIACRVPDDEVVVISNCYTIDTVNLKNKADCMGSPDIVDYAVKRGWYDPGRDGEFNFARTYASPGSIDTETNSLRRWRGISLLSKKRYKVNDTFPFSFTPRNRVSVSDITRILRDHYEGTKYDTTDGYKKGSPNSTKTRTICTDKTRYSIVAELRGHLPVEIAYRAWIAFRRPDSNAYSPWYVSITAPPDGYTNGDSAKAFSKHFKQPAQYLEFNQNFAYWYYAGLSELVDENYKKHIKIARHDWRNFEAYTSKQLGKIEKDFIRLIKSNKRIALNIITNHVWKLEYRRWHLASQLIRQMDRNSRFNGW